MGMQSPFGNPLTPQPGKRTRRDMQFPNLSPEIFAITVFGKTFALRWYAMAYIAGLLIGWQIVRSAIARPKLFGGTSPITKEQLDDLLTWVIVGVIVGGRLGYVLFYNWDYYAQNLIEIPQVWDGGMAFHGGFLGVVIATWACARKFNAPLGSLANLIALAAPPGLLLGRIANFINGELWGRATDVPWGVVFPSDAALCVTGPCARHPSQLYEAGLEGLLLGAVMLWLAFGRRWLSRPWSLVGVFLVGYGLARFAVEFVRQPDAQFVTPGNPLGLAYHIDGIGLTMGQTLSLPMIGLGLWLLLRR